MSRSRFAPTLVAAILVALFFGVALYLRVALPYDKVFVGDWVKFTGTDAWFFMRIVDNLAHNFPHLISFDPYLLYPGGSTISIPPFFSYFLASVIWLVSLGSPTQHIIDVVGVYFPAVLGALTVIPVYFIGKALFSRWAGVIAAGLVGLFPGEFLGRSVLGFTDYHVAEVLFTTVTMLFLILAVKTASQGQLTFEQLKRPDRTIIAKPLIYSLLAGIFLGIYFLTWQGALLFVFLIFVYLIVQFILDHLRGRSTDYLCFVSTVTFITTSLMFLPVFPVMMSLASLVIAIIVPVALVMLSRLMTSRGIRPIFYPAALFGFGLASLAIFYVINPSLLRAMMESLSIFVWPIGTTVLEMQPLLFPGGNFSWVVAWGNFTTSFFLCFIALGILIYFVVKRGETDKTLFVVWCLVILAATLAMRRFAYYFVVNVALLTGYLAWLVLEFAGFKKAAAVAIETPQKVKKKGKREKRQRDSSRFGASRANMALGVIVVFFVVFFPNIGGAIETASHPAFSPSDGWCESLSWLKDNTPEPFGDPDFYYSLYEPPAPGKSYSYPETAYGVTAWWDYGYWITRIGRRVPTSNPGTHQMGEARLFIAQDETAANEIMDGWGSKYVIVDHELAMPVGKFHAVATLSGDSKENFYDVYYQPQDGRLRPMILFYPEYYRSLVVRLYNFDGKRVIPRSSAVISYEERLTREGQPYKEITNVKSFPSYEQAEAYVASQKSGNYRVVSTDPFASSVPLQALEHYKIVYSSKGSKIMPSGGLISEVKIFEYVK